jgi:hypothetical protein
MVTGNMERIRFTKMSGSGNDFIIIDNRSGSDRCGSEQGPREDWPAGGSSPSERMG